MEICGREFYTVMIPHDARGTIVCLRIYTSGCTELTRRKSREQMTAAHSQQSRVMITHCAEVTMLLVHMIDSRLSALSVIQPGCLAGAA